MLIFNREKFLETEFGASMVSCASIWDMSLRGLREFELYQEEYKTCLKTDEFCISRWPVYQMAVKTFYGFDVEFVSADEYYGIQIKDKDEWIVKREMKGVAK